MDCCSTPPARRVRISSPGSQCTGASSRASLRASESAVLIPLQRRASTKSPAARAALGRAMAARSVCFVELSNAA
eukprot:7961091-Pyramimonas_sp.AAC.1